MKTNCTIRSIVAHALIAGMAIAPIPTFGNVFPSKLSQSANSINPAASETVTLSYLLNEDATNVTVRILDAATNVVRVIDAGVQSKGQQSVIWNGKDDSNNNVASGSYSFRVTASGDAKGGWTLISTDTELNNFELPRGVAVNKNPDSPYYGRVYVSNGRSASTAAGRAMSDGIYMLNADLSDTDIPGGTGPHTAGVAWQTSTGTPADTGGSSPFRLQVGPDDSLYITDWADSHSGLWQANPNVTSAVEVLDNTGRAASGLNETHGSISDVWISGIGENRVIFTADEDFIPPGGSTGSILRYDIGNTTTHSGAPSGFAFADGTGGGNRIINFLNSLAFDNQGNIWYSQTRAGISTEVVGSLFQIDTNGAIIWASVPDLAANSLADPLRNIQGIAYDPVNNLLALATARAGTIIIFNPVTKTVVVEFPYGATTSTDAAFDNVGNLYVGNRSAERVRVWSPPNDGTYVPNEFSTDSAIAVGPITVGIAALLQFSDISISGGNVVINISKEGVESYTVLRATNVTGPWIPVATNQTASQYSEPVSGDTAFFQLQAE